MPAGRPPEEHKTSMTRAWEEQVEMLGWLHRVTGVRSADFIGPRIHKELVAAFEAIKPTVEQIKAHEHRSTKRSRKSAKAGGG